MVVRRSKRLMDLPPLLFMETRRRIEEARARGIDVITLAIGDPDGATPEHVVEALAAAAADPATHRYPAGGTRGLPAYREAVAGWYARRFGVGLDPANEVLALIGSKEGNHHLGLALLDPGDLAMVPDPGYPAYESSVILSGARSVRLPLRESNSFLVDFDAISPAEASASKIIWLSYPNNPTSAVAPLEFLQRAVDFARENGLLVVNDNPYSEIAFDGERVHSILEADGAKDVAVEFNSLSKTYNMAGWRIGMAVGNRDALAAMAQVKDNTDTGIFPAVQLAGVAALEGPRALIEQQNAVYARRRDLVVDTLRRIELTVDPPKATFYVWAKLPEGRESAAVAAQLLAEAGVVVIPGSGYGVQGEGFVRLSLSVPDDRLAEAMVRIEAAAPTLGLQPA